MFPPPGKLFDLSTGARLHIWQKGTQGPTVIFEAGIAGSCLSWSTVQPLVAPFARAVSYDRAGLGWSAERLTPRTLHNMVAEMAELFRVSELAPPYVLVGHSFGCILIRAFADEFPLLVRGLVMVDPVTLEGWANPPPAQIQRLKLGAKLARRGSLLARMGVVRATLGALVGGGQLLPKVVARASAGQGNSVIKSLVQEVRKLPAEVQPMVAYHWGRAESFTGLAAYLECLPECARRAIGIPIPAQTPCVILSAETAGLAELDERNAWIAANPQARQIQVRGTTHWLQLERPDVVADTVESLCSQVR